MTTNEINNILLNKTTYKNGQNVKVIAATDMSNKTLKAHKGEHSIIKYTIGTYRIGVKNENTKWAKDKVAKGGTIEPRVWGVWSTIKGEINKFIKHNGNDYIALFPSSHGWKMTTYYMVDGVKMTKDQVEKMGVLYSSAFSHIDDNTPYITYKVENIDTLIIKGIAYK